jgi:crossover junction endodeoxyribonuclease RuvC
MRVLGIDPGLTRCGVGVIEGEPGRTPRLVQAGVIRTPADASLGVRLTSLERELVQWLAEYRPDAVAVERVFSRRDVTTIIGTAQASGVAILTATRAGIPVTERTPTEVKAAITGSGRADKAQVGFMVMRVLKLDEPPRPADAADAVALALCQLWRAPAQARIEQARLRAELAAGAVRSRAKANERKLG